MTTAKKKNNSNKFALSKKELEEKARYEEFWSDPCWTQPLDSQQGQLQ